MKASFSVEHPSGQKLSITSFIEKLTDGRPMQTLQIFTGGITPPVLTLLWPAGPGILGEGPVPATLTIGDQQREVSFRKGTMHLNDEASDDELPTLHDFDEKTLDPLLTAVKTIYAPLDKDLSPKVGTDDDALGTISSAATIGGAIGGGVGLVLGAPAGPVGMATGAAIFGAAGAVVGLEVGVEIVVAQAVYDAL